MVLIYKGKVDSQGHIFNNMGAVQGKVHQNGSITNKFGGYSGFSQGNSVFLFDDEEEDY